MVNCAQYQAARPQRECGCRLSKDDAGLYDFLEYYIEASTHGGHLRKTEKIKGISRSSFYKHG